MTATTSWSGIRSSKTEYRQNNAVHTGMSGTVSHLSKPLPWEQLGEEQPMRIPPAKGVTLLADSPAKPHGNSKFLRSILRDLGMIKAFINIKLSFRKYQLTKATVGSLFQKTADRFPNKLAIVCDDTQWTFSQMQNFSNRVANFFCSHDLKKNDVVALFGNSSAEYVGLWLGLSQIGAISALVNATLRGEPLMHSITAAKAKIIIVDMDLRDQFEAVRAAFPKASVYYYHSGEATGKKQNSSDPVLNTLLENAALQPEIGSRSSNMNDKLFYIFTSGTTGLPKPCIITHRRFVLFSKIIEQMTSMSSDDTIYCPLPLYHTAGGVAAIGQAVLNGTTIVVRKKFSASSFWQDVAKNQCTAVQYIGEICRFLLAQAPSEWERKHKLRVAYGQGLRPVIWKEFERRFGIPRIVEMYGSTEGNAGLANTEGKPGAVGYISPFLHKVHPQAIVRVNKETGQFITDETGFCRKISPGEEGELLGQITKDPLKKFDGYTDQNATSSKIAENVFRKGDQYCKTGDIMTVDEEGFVYFLDRLGDAYRWKGENVSSSQVESVISSLCDHVDVAVYGVSIPGTEGKAGMACITSNGEVPDVDQLQRKFSQHLSNFALPIFLRFTKSLQLTGTFRLQKSTLKAEEFDPVKCGSDVLYYLNPSVDGYQPLTPQIHQAILQQQIRF